jgi:hypothetical protein
MVYTTMTNNRFGRGLILAVTTPKSLKVRDRLIYYVQSEKNYNVRYRVDLEGENGPKCECPDFVHRGNICKHIFKIIAEEIS